MKHFRGAIAAGVLLAAGLGSSVQAQQNPGPDALTDPSMKGPEVVAFIGLKPGDKVADIVAGRFVRALSQAVGPNGKVYAVMPAEVVKAHPEVIPMLTQVAAQPAHRNVVVSQPPVNAMALPSGLDAVFIRQNYHDLYDKFMGPADVDGFNRAVYAALKPGGVYVILDHAAAPGAPMSVTETLHRIDVSRVKADVMKAGFRLDSESKAVADPADDHTKMVFNPAIRGKTDQFLLKFRKPK
ncbi:methyltransferase [Phenylobacterium sp.]|jgi:predicted methyltransferase|uniref:methyltransferase n=1 Tax=Phenylobacterium sp. TaxID=1871053 RepID=UPI002F91E30F